ncbi:carboxypeptidase-like regulatory domain-containing protein [Maribacter sp. IgM3_T14_3]|uniref:carboxypeptidase-like regulatory domain-containing protein n=1 Tax=Maribacter sp. IgM3_T14_3 TaxID=3415140 RepID=UPI003C6EBAE1
MKKIIVLFVLACTFSFAQEKKNSIKGKITYLETPLVNAEIKVVETNEMVKSNVNGTYQIKALPGQSLIFSYPSMSSIEILVEDVTRILNIELTPEINQLDEVTVEKTVIKSQKQLRSEYATNKKLINTAFGILDKEITSFSIKILEGKDLNPIGGNLGSILQYRIPGIKVECSTCTIPSAIYLRGASMGMFPAVYDIDGLVVKDFPSFLDVNNIERVAVISSLGAATKYGGIANGGVIVINTKGANFFPEPGSDIPYDQAKLRNNKYDNSALSSSDLKLDKPTYLNKLLSSTTESEAIELYKNQVKMYGSSYTYVLDAYDYFSQRWKNIDFADEIIQDNRGLFNENPLALKSLAYIYQAEGRLEKANEIYKEVFTLRANYAQSYLDMAESYIEINEFQKAASIYARYGYLLEQGFLRAEGDLGIIMERELNNLIALKGKELLSSKELKNIVLDDEFDGTRLVFEWNDSEAEFELEFVNPEGNYFKSEHSLFADANRIKNEKISGFSTEEYLIDDTLRGTWQINAKYLGNKSLTPTYLKATIYHNYGSASQRKEVKVFKLNIRNVSQQLFSVSNATSIVSN